MDQALNQAAIAASKNEVPVGAIISIDNKIIATGHNLVEQENSALMHAECIAISEASKKLKNWRLLNTTLAVTLEPCAMCMGAIANSRIETLIIGAKDPRIGACGGKFDISSFYPIKVVWGIREEECSKILRDFFEKKRDEVK